MPLQSPQVQLPKEGDSIVLPDGFEAKVIHATREGDRVGVVYRDDRAGKPFKVIFLGTRNCIAVEN